MGPGGPKPSLKVLRKQSVKHHDAVTQLETGLKTRISEVDLRRALGLAFQEFENRIEDVPRATLALVIRDYS